MASMASESEHQYPSVTLAYFEYLESCRSMTYDDLKTLRDSDWEDIDKIVDHTYYLYTEL